MKERTRQAAASISHLLKQFPCVLITGARQTGKTTLARQVLPKSTVYDLEDDRDYDRIAFDCLFFLETRNQPIILDEVQHLEKLFPALKLAIDKMPEVNGRFLITSSGAPNLVEKLQQTLGQRLAIFELGGLQLEEAWQREPSYFYEILLTGNPDDLYCLTTEEKTDNLFNSCLRGALPVPFLNPGLARNWLEQYYRNYLDRDLQSHFPGLKTRTFRTFLRMLASSSGYVQNASNLARSLKVSVPTVQKYLKIAETLNLWRRIPCYYDTGGKRVVKTARGHLRDMGLLNMALEIHNQDTLNSHVNLSAIWRSFITEELIKGFSSRLIAVKPYFYKTHNQAEIDLVLEGEFGVLPIDIKLGLKTEPGKIRALSAFVRDFNCKFGLVFNLSDKVAKINEKVIQIPATCL